MSDITCRNTIFHIELVHDFWIKVAHQNFQGLIRMLVFPVLWQVQGEQVPGTGRTALPQSGLPTHTRLPARWRRAERPQYVPKLHVSGGDTHQQSEFKRPMQ